MEIVINQPKIMSVSLKNGWVCSRVTALMRIYPMAIVLVTRARAVNVNRIPKNRLTFSSICSSHSLRRARNPVIKQVPRMKFV